jgi:hypothetical protein
MKDYSIFVTIIGTPRNGWNLGVKINQSVYLSKETDNEADTEAIKILDTADREIGYIANSCKTVVRGTYSSGRAYDKVTACCRAVIKFILPDGRAIAELQDIQE